jgi:hypothetical protein
LDQGVFFEEAFIRSAMLSLPTRIELEREEEFEKTSTQALDSLIRELSETALKKKT